MPDISMCNNKECVLMFKFYRFTAIPFPLWQSYCYFKPEENGICLNFWDNEGERNRE